MFLNKLAATTLLLTGGTYASNKNRFNYQTAQCEDKPSTAAEKGAKDLDAIFASAEGGLPPDPEEI